MQGTNYLLVILACFGLFMLGAHFIRYCRFSSRKIPALKLCLALIALAMLLCASTLAVFLMHDSAYLPIAIAVNVVCIVFNNTMFVHVGLRMLGSTKKGFVRALWMLYLVPLLLLPGMLRQYLTMPLLYDEAGYGFAYELVPIGYVLTVYNFLISMLVVFYTIRPSARSPLRGRKLRWMLLLAVALPSLANVFQVIHPLFVYLNFNSLTIWIPVYIICYVYFGYLSSARTNAIEYMDEVYALFDLWGNCVDINESGRRFFKRFCGTNTPSLQHLTTLLGREPEGSFQDLQLILEYEGEKTYYTLDSFSVSDNISRYSGLGFIISEVTEYHLRMAQLDALATEDPLTGAKNRRYLESYLDNLQRNAGARKAPMAVMMLDIDLFKNINDNFGHKAGDEVLVELCRRCEANMRKQDILFRYGGEEFLIVSEGVDHESGQKLARRIHEAIGSRLFTTAEGEIPVTVSVGFCSVDIEGNMDIYKMVELADEKLYEAKNNGRNRVECCSYAFYFQQQPLQ
ncbi:diguanylate cyclase [Ruminococcaceae bacterium OttesenSCG-928-I18]|nr:diguanylate cyclase [Ruminococcaceae bacterium OttesenSCG-928-I18]